MLTTEGPVEFCKSDENYNYIDFVNAFLYVLASISASDGISKRRNSRGMYSNSLHTLRSQCDMYLNSSLVTQSNNNYPYIMHTLKIYCGFASRQKPRSFLLF